MHYACANSAPHLMEKGSQANQVEEKTDDLTQKDTFLSLSLYIIEYIYICIYIYMYYMLLNKLPSNKLPRAGAPQGPRKAAQALPQAAAQGPRKDPAQET